LLVAAAFCAANPFVETFLSEVGVDPAGQFVELCCAPYPQPVDLTGWQLITSMSTCTLDYYLSSGEFLVVDSAGLAQGLIGRGKLRLNPLGDSVVLLYDSGGIADRVTYPRYPTGYDSAPLPPATGSVSFWNYDDVEDQSMNWYIDSTPTPGAGNDDYSLISGSVTGSGGEVLDEVVVWASGRNGDCHRGLYRQSDFSIGGLGAGTYQVGAWAYHHSHSYSVTYPESVFVGYAQTTSGINIVVPLTGVAEPTRPTAGSLPLMRVSGQSLLVTGNGVSPVTVELYNQLGSHVSTFHLGPIRGEKRVEIPASLAAGVYFVDCTCRATTISTKLVLY
jgi:hypothetical protein